jgi:hypothetical protein
MLSANQLWKWAKIPQAPPAERKLLRRGICKESPSPVLEFAIGKQLPGWNILVPERVLGMRILVQFLIILAYCSPDWLVLAEKEQKMTPFFFVWVPLSLIHIS